MVGEVNKLVLPPVSWVFSILLIIWSLIFSYGKPCTCTSSNQIKKTAIYSRSTTFARMDQGLLFRLGRGSTTLLPGTLGYYMKNSSSPPFNLSDSGWFIIPKWVDLWKTSDGYDGRNYHEVSFSIIFTLSVYGTRGRLYSKLLFDILPRLEQHSESPPTGYTPFSSELVEIKSLNSTGFHSGRTVRVEFEFAAPRNSSTRGRYCSVWIDYNRASHNLSVYIAPGAAGKEKPSRANKVKHLDARDSISANGLFGFSASLGQLLQLHTWNSTIEFVIPEIEDSPRKKTSIAVILPSVLGAAAATAVIAAAVYFYFNSKYRRWKKDLDQLAESMQLLPGVPIQFNFTDIKKATNNFHETKRLGQGGFGAVYRCRLPSPNKGEVLEVAAKKFTRYNNRRYQDFLAEVSIINRLRHKNIVPLIGWSYNRGEPALIYEYMPNGSLDQHLFRSSTNQQQELTFIYRWETRYNIVKDIATGLQYVHHEYEPMVLHRDIKASNIMIDSAFQGRLGDFGLACVVADGKSSYTDLGIPGTIGFRAPEYIYSGKATTKTDIFAFGVLVLEIVTGNRAIAQVGHVTDWVWKLHWEGKLLSAVDPMLTDTEFNADEATRLLLLGMACSNPNPWDRPSMAEVVQIISKSVPPPDVPLLKPTISWPPQGWSSLTSEQSTSVSNMDWNPSMMIETACGGRTSSENEGGRLIDYPRGRSFSPDSSSVYQSAHAGPIE